MASVKGGSAKLAIPVVSTVMQRAKMVNNFFMMHPRLHLMSHVEYSTRKMQRNCEDHLMVQLKLRIDQGFYQ